LLRRVASLLAVDYLAQLFDDVSVVLSLMGDQAPLAAFDAVIEPDKVPAALVAAEIKRTIAKQAVEVPGRIRFMARKRLAFFMTEEGV
jgi:hypothetical protein